MKQFGVSIIAKDMPAEYAPFYGYADTLWVMKVNGQEFMRSVERESLWRLAWEVMAEMQHEAA